MSKKRPIQSQVNKQVQKETSLDFKEDLFSKRNLLAFFIFIGVTFAIYYKTFGFEYALDDIMMIQENKFTKKGFEGMFDHLTSESMTGYFGEQRNLLPGSRYRPLSLVTFAAEYGLVGDLSPKLSHLINVILYAFSGIFIFILFNLLTKSPISVLSKWTDNQKYCFAIFGSLFFLVHPLHVEVVANIKGRDEIMALLFSIWALYKFVRYALSLNVTNLYVGSVLFFLALLSKENSITFLAIIPLTIFFFVGKQFTKPLMYALVTTIVYLCWRFSVIGVPEIGLVSKDLMNNPFLEMNFLEKLATIFYTLGLYVKLMIYPNPLTHDYYPYAIPKMNFGNWQVLLSLFTYGVLAYIAVKQWTRKSIVSYSILYYLTTLSIVSNVFINLGTFMNDRFLYMPSLGLAILSSYVVIWVSEKVKHNNKLIISCCIGAIMLLPYAVRSYVRVPAWQNNFTLNTSAMPTSIGSARANIFMATALYNQYMNIAIPDKKKNDIDLLYQALPYAERGIKIHREYANGYIMLAGITSQIYTYDRDLPKFLKQFYIVATNKPDTNQKPQADGKLVSFVTEFCEYLNTSASDSQALGSWYNNVLQNLLDSGDIGKMQWALSIGNIAQSRFANDPTLEGIIIKLNNTLGKSR
jgi:protein O-mannosyl-transferase